MPRASALFVCGFTVRRVAGEEGSERGRKRGRDLRFNLRTRWRADTDVSGEKLFQLTSEKEVGGAGAATARWQAGFDPCHSRHLQGSLTPPPSEAGEAFHLKHPAADRTVPPFFFSFFFSSFSADVARRGDGAGGGAQQVGSTRGIIDAARCA